MTYKFSKGHAMNDQNASVAAKNSRLSRITRGLLAGLGATVLLVSAPAFAVAVAPDLGAAFDYTVLGANPTPTVGTVTCTNTGPGSTINGDVGSTFTSITNTGCSITGATDAPVAASVVTDFNNAYSALDTQNPTCDGVIPTTSTILPPGVYCSAAGTTIGAGVILQLNGNASDVWVFKVGTGGTGALTGNSFQVVMGGTAQACNVYWRTAEAATLTDSIFKGTILSGSAFTMIRGNYEGRGLAKTDATVTDAAQMTFAGCAAPVSITVNKDFSDNSAAIVPVALTCTSGTVSATPLNAAEGAPAVFTVTGASAGATCTATETVPAGYTADQTGCVGVALNGSCTITNTLIPLGAATITVN
ncbi:MAG: ice-binding family protein, partial [Thiobacillus sp.]